MWYEKNNLKKKHTLHKLMSHKMAIIMSKFQVKIKQKKVLANDLENGYFTNFDQITNFEGLYDYII